MVSKLVVETRKLVWRALKWAAIDPAIEGWKSAGGRAADGRECEKNTDPQTGPHGDRLDRAANEVVSRCAECGIGLTLVTGYLRDGRPYCRSCLHRVTSWTMTVKPPALDREKEQVCDDTQAGYLSQFMG